MASSAEIEAKFWKAIKSDRTVMLGLSGGGETHAQPMTAQLDKGKDDGSLFFFTAKDVHLAQAVGAGGAALITFASKGHDLFATVEGRLVTETDPAAIERLWNPFVAAWYQGGKDDPKLQLLRFDPGDAQIWLNENSVFAAARMLLGRDPKEDYQDKVTEVNLG